MMFRTKVVVLLLFGASGILACSTIPSAMVQKTTPAPSSYPPPVTFTAEQDHQNMMDQLGIRALRRAPNGNETGPIF